MRDFFSIDGDFFKMGAIITDMFLLSLLWFIFSVPIITIGASTTAVFYVGTKRVQDKEGYLFKDFLQSFKYNFKQATLVWIIIILMYIQLFINIRIINTSMEGILGIFLMSLAIIMGILITFFSIYVFPIISRFKMSLIDIIKLSILLSLKHLFTSVLCILFGIAIIIFTVKTIIFGFIAMGFYTIITSYFFMKIFRKYSPNIDDDNLYKEIKLNNM